MADLPNLIADTVEAVKAIKQNGWPKSSMSGLRPFRYYDQVKVLSTLLDEESECTSNIPAVLEKLQGEPNLDDDEVLGAAMQFFQDLAREALKQSHRSIDEVVTGLRA